MDDDRDRNEAMKSQAPKHRGRRWEAEVADMIDGTRWGRAHEPDVVSDELVVECKNEKGLAVSANAIDTARGWSAGRSRGRVRGLGKGLPWAVFKRQKGAQRFTVTVDGDYFLRLLELQRSLAVDATYASLWWDLSPRTRDAVKLLLDLDDNGSPIVTPELDEYGE